MQTPDYNTEEAWDQNRRSQWHTFRSMSLRQKMEAVEGMANVIRHFKKMRAEGSFRPATADNEKPIGKQTR